MHRLMSLSCGSIKSHHVDALQENGIKTVADFISYEAGRLAQKISVPTKDLSSLQNTVISQMASFTMNGSDFYEEMMTRFCILPTGCDNLDELLDGGLYTGELTEIVGAAGAGKSQICMSIAMFTAMEAKKNVVYIDTGGSFSGARIKEMLQGWNNSLDDQEVCNMLSRISIIQAFDIFSVLEALEGVRQRIAKQVEDNNSGDNTQHLRMVIVDSVAAVVSPILGGQQTHGHSLMVNLSRILKSLAVEHSIAVVITNNVVTDSSKSLFSTKPALGPTWAHVPNTRLFIQKQIDNPAAERIATVIKSSRQVLPLEVFHVQFPRRARAQNRRKFRNYIKSFSKYQNSGITTRNSIFNSVQLSMNSNLITTFENHICMTAFLNNNLGKQVLDSIINSTAG